MNEIESKPAVYSAKNWNEMSSGLFLYRGFTRKFFTEVSEINYPEKRSPVSITPEQQLEIDNFFEEKFGVRFRERSIFCSGALSMAEDYKQINGEVRSIRPVGDFMFCWSPKSKDLYYEIEYKPARESIAEMLDRLDFQDHDLASAIISGNEIMLTGVNGSKFYAEAIK